MGDWGRGPAVEDGYAWAHHPQRPNRGPAGGRKKRVQPPWLVYEWLVAQVKAEDPMVLVLPAPQRGPPKSLGSRRRQW